MRYQDINSEVVDKWCKKGWKWGQMIDHATYIRALAGDYALFLTPTKPVPKSWFKDIRGAKVLGLASGGGQQMPILSALGARCTLLDYSLVQCQSDQIVAEREGYDIEIIRADMTRPLPFADETFDMIINPVSNCYIKEIDPVFKECYRILKEGGELIGGYGMGIVEAYDDDDVLRYKLPFDPIAYPEHKKACVDNDWGMNFSHSVGEQINGQLKAGFKISEVYDDTSGIGLLEEYKIPTYIAIRAKK